VREVLHIALEAVVCAIGQGGEGGGAGHVADEAASVGYGTHFLV